MDMDYCLRDVWLTVVELVTLVYVSSCALNVFRMCKFECYPPSLLTVLNNHYMSVCCYGPHVSLYCIPSRYNAYCTRSECRYQCVMKLLDFNF
jgi:hypothetical protein